MTSQLFVQVTASCNGKIEVVLAGRERRDGLDQILEALLADQPPRGKDQSVGIRQPELPAAYAACFHIGPETCGVNAIRNDVDGVWTCAKRDRPRSEIVAARG